jgi:hypothetical protein
VPWDDEVTDKEGRPWDPARKNLENARRSMTAEEIGAQIYDDIIGSVGGVSSDQWKYDLVMLSDGHHDLTAGGDEDGTGSGRGMTRATPQGLGLRTCRRHRIVRASVSL